MQQAFGDFFFLLATTRAQNRKKEHTHNFDCIVHNLIHATELKIPPLQIQAVFVTTPRKNPTSRSHSKLVGYLGMNSYGATTVEDLSRRTNGYHYAETGFLSAFVDLLNSIT